MKLDADGARARHQGEDRRSAEARPRSPPRRPSSRSRSPRCRSRCARSRSRRATIPRDFALVASGGAGPLHVCAIARELYIPTVIVPLFPSHFSALGMLLADERHDFIRTFYSDLASVDFAELAKIHRRDGRGSQREPAPRSGRGASDPSRPALRRPGVHAAGAGQRRASSSAADRAGIRTAFDALYEHRYAHHSPDEPVEMVNIRLGADRQAAEAELSALRQRASARSRRGEREVYFSDTRKAAALPGLSARDARRRREIAGPALIQEHGTTTVLFERRRLPRSRTSGESDHHGRRRRGMTTTALDTVTLEVIRNALPAIANEMAADLQRTSYNMMIYEVRDYCTALLDTEGRADLAERRRRVALRRRPRRARHRRHAALRRGRLQAGRRHHHQPPGGRRPAPQQRRHLHALFLQGRAADVRRWCARTGSTSAALAPASAPAPTVADPWLEGLQLDQLKIYEEGKLDETLYRVIKDNIRFPESSLGDMKSQMAACRLGGAAAGRAVRQIRPRHAARGDRADLRRDRAASAATWWRSCPTASTRPSALDRRRRRRSRASRCRSTSRSRSKAAT